MVRWRTIAAVAVLTGCSSTGTGDCQHPCDLAQTLHVAIEGSEPATSVTASGDCRGGGACALPEGCRSVDVYLTAGAGGGPDAAELVCRVTAVSAGGATVEREAVARFISSPCCSGYEFVTQTVTITF